MCHGTVIKVSAGGYTLVHDTLPQPETDFTLDVTLFADSNGRKYHIVQMFGRGKYWQISAFWFVYSAYH